MKRELEQVDVKASVGIDTSRGLTLHSRNRLGSGVRHQNDQSHDQSPNENAGENEAAGSDWTRHDEADQA